MLLEPRLLSVAQRYYVFAILTLVVWSVTRLSSSDFALASKRRFSVLHSTLKTTSASKIATASNTSLAIDETARPEVFNSVSETHSHAEPGRETSNPEREPSDPVRDAIRTLFGSVKLDSTQRSYRDADGKYFTGAYGNHSTWKQPLGSKVVIVDVDTRVPSGENQILNAEKKINWGKLETHGPGLISHAITSHYLYAMIHGYDYKYYQAANIPGHHDTWIKPHLIKDMLPDYQFVITMDADAVVAHPEIPLEWLFNRWGIAEHTSIAMPHDTEEYINGEPNTEDSKGVPVLNSGFIVTQNNEITFEMLEAWGNCTTEVRYPGCGHWKENWSHEQRAFSEYIRYDFDRTPQTIIGIPCDDGMGYPGFHEQAGPNFETADCKGNFIRHYTLGKGTVHAAATETIAQVLVEVLQKSLLQHADEVWKKEVEPVLAEEKNEISKEIEAGEREEEEKKKEEERRKEEEEERRKEEEERRKEEEERKDEEQGEKEKEKKDDEEEDTEKNKHKKMRTELEEETYPKATKTQANVKANEEEEDDEDDEDDEDEEEEEEVKHQLDSRPVPEQGEGSPLMLSGLMLDA